jgi:hypothetical protein
MKLLFALWIIGGCVWAQATRTPNTLSPEEQKEGFILLFDGKSLDKWDVRPGQTTWKIADGAIKSESSAAGATLLTKEDFANYILRAEFRAHPQVNSGIMLRQSRPGTGGGDQQSKGKQAAGAGGYELQIRDKTGEFPSGDFMTASIVNVGKAPADAKILPGQWNTFEITMNGDHMVVVYNGRKVVDGHDSRLRSGAIGLQSAHAEDPPGAGIEFRNLKVKRLP